MYRLMENQPAYCGRFFCSLSCIRKETSLSSLASPWALLATVSKHRALIANLVRREIAGRYRGSFMGFLWSFFNPVLMLLVYTFVFSVVFKARWAGGSDSKTEFALVLFAGLMLFNLFSECVTRAPGLIVGSVNYVKKVIFPLEVLPLVVMGAALFHFVISLLVWLAFYMVFFGAPQPTLLLLPLVVLPFLLMILGLSWLLASLGVYLRDVSQVVGVLVMVMMFMSPLFYPVEALPEDFQQWMQLSPLTFAVEQARNVMYWGKPIAWQAWWPQMGWAILVAWLGFAWFQKTRKGFADVL